MTYGDRRYRLLTTVAAAVSALASLGAVGINEIFTAGRPRPPLNWGSTGDLISWNLIMASAVVVAVLVAHREPENPIGLPLALGAAAGTVATLGDAWGAYALQVRGGDVPGGTIGVHISYGLLLITWCTLGVVVPLRFPSGHLLSPRWRWVERAGIVFAMLWALAALSPTWFAGLDDDFAGVKNPLGIPGSAGVLELVGAIGIFGLFAASLTGVVSLVVRFRRSDGIQRRQVRVVALTTLIVTVALLLLANLMTPLVDSWAIGPIRLLAGLLPFALPASMGVAILRHGLYEVEVVVSKALLSALLLLFVTGTYVAVVAGIGSALGSTRENDLGVSVAASALVALAFHPFRMRAERVANRMVFGERATPYEVVAQFSRQVGESLEANDLLHRMAEAAATGVAAASAQVRVLLPGGESRAATWPPEAPAATRQQVIAITHLGEHVGDLMVAEQPASPLSKPDVRILEDLASQAGIALRNAQLTAELEARAEELRRSRRRLLEAQDTERRRMERDLHDGAQQRLVGLSLLLRMVRDAMTGSADKAAMQLLDEAVSEAAGAHGELRDLARGIYPAALTEGGLGRALESLAERAPLPVEVEAAYDRYSPIVEATAYFVVSECLTNAVKHASASFVSIRAERRENLLLVEVCDDGSGGADPLSSGLRGLADRVASIDGFLEIDSPIGVGTTVRAKVPCARVDQ